MGLLLWLRSSYFSSRSLSDSMPEASNSVGKGARLFGHPVHPVLTDFPIALWSISLLSDVVGLWRGEAAYRQFAFWAIAVGLVIAVPAIVAGLIDYAAIPQGHPAIKGATWHMWVMLSAAIAYGCSLIAHIGRFASSSFAIWMSIGSSAAGLVLLIIGGWFGGEMVFRYGIGSQSDSQTRNEESTRHQTGLGTKA